MYVILHNNDVATNEFVSFLDANSKKKPYVAITLQELINDVKIVDKLYDRKNTCNWNLRGETINYDKVSGFLNRIKWVDISLFDDYVEEDRAYVQSEWWAYLVYRVNNTKNAMNPYTGEMLSAQFFQFPFQFQACYNAGFVTPKFQVSNEKALLQQFAEQHDFISRDTLYDNFDFRRSKEVTSTTNAMIEFVPGSTLIVHTVNHQIFATEIGRHGKQAYQLPPEVCEKVIKLVDQLGVKSVELMLKVSPADEYVAHYISAFPSYDYCNEANKETLYAELHKALRA